ncbi:MAG TPA: hypothetical protein VGB78_04350 [Thermoplasmata archaeon]
MGESTDNILGELRRGLRPPTEEECNHAKARWLFGDSAEKMMKHAPWSFLLAKLMWKKGEEPWRK